MISHLDILIVALIGGLAIAYLARRFRRGRCERSGAARCNCSLSLICGNEDDRSA